jgi:hypothetical protein
VARQPHLQVRQGALNVFARTRCQCDSAPIAVMSGDGDGNPRRQKVDWAGQWCSRIVGTIFGIAHWTPGAASGKNQRHSPNSSE